MRSEPASLGSEFGVWEGRVGKRHLSSCLGRVALQKFLKKPLSTEAVVLKSFGECLDAERYRDSRVITDRASDLQPRKALDKGKGRICPLL